MPAISSNQLLFDFVLLLTLHQIRQDLSQDDMASQALDALHQSLEYVSRTMLYKLPLFAASLLENAPCQKAGEQEEMDQRLVQVGVRDVLLGILMIQFELSFQFRKADFDFIIEFTMGKRKHLRFFLSSNHHPMAHF